MPTGPSWADSRADSWADAVRREAAEWRTAVADLRHLLWFRRQSTRRVAVTVALAVVGMITVAVAVAPAWWPARDAADADRVGDLLPAYLLALVAIGATNAVAAGGGREVLARDAAAVHPVGPFTDHLGALVLAPLSAAWLLQTWCLLGAAAWVAGPHPLRVVAAELVASGWIVCATAAGQAFGWWVEWLRRGPRGLLVVRCLVGVAVAVGATVGALPDPRRAALGGPVGWTADALTGSGSTPGVLAGLVAASTFLVLLGGHAARLAGCRPPRAEAQLESRPYPARAAARSDLTALVRIDRGSVWRSLPVRRGIGFLTLAPGLVAIAHPLGWETIIVLPGLVVSGCVLLFGVNAWALDGGGLLWRESLPVSPAAQLWARGWVLAELLLGAGASTVVLSSLRAGRPSPEDLVAVVVALVVVTGQALSGGLRWSLRSPHAVDYRSARATPAPPLTMVGYSVRLALATTTTTMVLGAFAATGRADLVLGTGALLLAFTAVRLLRVGRRWADPVRRSRVVAAVAG